MAATSWRALSALPSRITASAGADLYSRIYVRSGARDLLQHGPTRLARTWAFGLASNCERKHFPASSLRVSHLWGFGGTQSEVVDKVKEEIETLSPNKIFAVVHISGRQFKIAPNDLIVINRIAADIGEKIYLEKVLLAGSENFTLVGTPLLSNEKVRVLATVTEHSKTAKVIVFKKKRRKNYKRKRGHRQDITVLRINDVHISSDIH
jgi:large subunit ribosomal protein L21